MSRRAERDDGPRKRRDCDRRAARRATAERKHQALIAEKPPAPAVIKHPVVRR